MSEVNDRIRRNLTIEQVMLGDDKDAPFLNIYRNFDEGYLMAQGCANTSPSYFTVNFYGVFRVMQFKNQQCADAWLSENEGNFYSIFKVEVPTVHN